MEGTWAVKERTWEAADAKPVNLPDATAERVLINGLFTQETMTSLPGITGRFTRVSYLDFNEADQLYQYFSLDSRTPQMMNERGTASKDATPLNLLGGKFVAPTCASKKNVPFTYRIVLRPVSDDEQIVRLYLTPVAPIRRRNQCRIGSAPSSLPFVSKELSGVIKNSARFSG